MSDQNKEKLTRLPLFTKNKKVEQEAIKLLQECLQIDTTNPPGNEMILAEFLKEKYDALICDYIETKIIETGPNRGNLIVTIRGENPENRPIWGFAAHLDVVPAEGKWDHGPFSGDLTTEGNTRYIWGRGSFDMKQTVVAHAMASLLLLRDGFRPKGDIKIIFEADEERGGHEGAAPLVDKHFDDVKVDCLITEGGGVQLPTGDDFIIQRAEKGKCQIKLNISGIPGHGSTPPPYEDFALYKSVKILDKIRDRKVKLHLSDEYRATIAALSVPNFAKFFLKKKRFIPFALKLFSKVLNTDLTKAFIPLISDTISPTIIKSGVKVNVISPESEVHLDIRTLPGHDRKYILNKIKNLVGSELFKNIDVSDIDIVDASTSSIDTPHYSKVEEVLKSIYPDANLVPILGTGGTDMKHWRRKGVPCYGFSMMMKDPDMSYSDFLGLAHAPNERISVRNLMLATEFAYRFMQSL